MSRTVYLDHHATTPLDQRVLQTMQPYFEAEYGNAASASHDWGRSAAEAVARARDAVAAFLCAEPDEIIFTAGATEADNLAIKGCARAARKQGLGNHLVTTAIEHHAVMLSMEALRDEGFELTVVRPDDQGLVSADAIGNALRDDTVLVSVMSANGEIGTLQPVSDIGALCRDRGVLFHTDATQTVGKLPVDVSRYRCHLLSLSAHKFYGPKGVGALYARRGVSIEPLFSGGGQERGIRSGTLNVPGIVGLGETCRLRGLEMETDAERETALRNELWRRIQARIPDAVLNGCLENRLPGNLNVSFPRCEGEALLAALDGYALSTGSACQSGVSEPSEVLLAIGREPNLARSSLRFGLGRSTRPEALAELADRLETAVKRLRALAPEPE